MIVLLEVEARAAFMVTIGCFEDGGREEMQSLYFILHIKILPYFPTYQTYDFIKITCICTIVNWKNVNIR